MLHFIYSSLYFSATFFQYTIIGNKMEAFAMNNTTLKFGWLSPAGELWECCSYDHCSTARKIVDKYGYATIQHRCADDCLMANGWAYIGTSEFDYEYRIGWKNFLTDYQKNFLRPYFEDPTTPVNLIARQRWESEL